MPVGTDLNTLKVQNLTMAELLRSAGCYLPSAATATARDQEIALEQVFCENEPVVLASRRELDPRSCWCHVLTAPVSAEDFLHDTLPAAAITKMMLARRLQIRDGLTMKDCFRLFGSLNKAEI